MMLSVPFPILQFILYHIPVYYCVLIFIFFTSAATAVKVWFGYGYMVYQPLLPSLLMGYGDRQVIY
jgi:hypothetical protein